MHAIVQNVFSPIVSVRDLIDFYKITDYATDTEVIKYRKYKQIKKLNWKILGYFVKKVDAEEFSNEGLFGDSGDWNLRQSG